MLKTALVLAILLTIFTPAIPWNSSEFTTIPSPYGAGETASSSGVAQTQLPLSQQPVDHHNSPKCMNCVMGEIDVQAGPEGMAYDSGNGNIYVANSQRSTVSVINDTNNTVVKTIAVGDWPLAVEYDGANGDLYVPNDFSNSVSVIDGQTNTIVKNISVGLLPHDVVYDSDNNDLYVANGRSDNVSVISGSTNLVIGSVPLVVCSGNTLPTSLVYDNANGDVYVICHPLGGTIGPVKVIDGSTNQVIASINAGGGPQYGSYDSVNGDIYVTNTGSNNITIINGANNTVAGSIPGGTGPMGIAYASGNGDLYVVDSDGNLSVISPATNATVALINIGTEIPWYALYDRSNRDIYVSNEEWVTVTVIATSPTTPVLTSVSVYPSSAIVLTGKNVTFGAIPYCTPGRFCPPGVSYSWSLSSTLGQLNASSGNPINVTAGYTIGSTTLFVNATLNGTTVQSGAVPITISGANIASVSVSPTSATLFTYDAQTFTATATCSSGPCPLGLTYSWSLTKTLGSLNTSSGPMVKLTTGSATGTMALFVNATLNGSVVRSSPVMITIVPALVGVTVNPSFADLITGESQVFNATPSCTGGTCPGGATYSWSLTNGLGSFNTTSGQSVKFTAGNTPGALNVFVNCTLNGQTSRSSAVQVTVTFPQPVISRFTTSPNSITVNLTTYLNVTASGGTGPLSYLYLGLPEGCHSSNITSLVCTPSAYGTFVVRVYVNDSLHQSANTTAQLWVSPALLKLVSFTASPNPIVVNHTTFLNVTATGGAGVRKYTYMDLPPGCATSNSSSITCTPNTVGAWTVRVYVNDTVGYWVSSVVLLGVNLLPLRITSFTAAPSTMYLNGTLSLSVGAAGGTFPYTYDYTGLPSGCTTASTSSLECIPKVAGSFTIRVFVNDSASHSANMTASLTIIRVSPLVISAFAAAPNPVVANHKTFLNTTATGGIGTLSYAYTGLPAGCITADTPSLSCTPSSAGAFAVTVFVNDSDLHTVTASLTLTVNPVTLPTISAFTASPNPILVGQATHVDVSASGGIGTLSYAYSGLPPGCATVNTPSLTCVPTAIGAFDVRVFANDTASQSANATTTLTVSAPVVTLVSVSIVPTSVSVTSGGTTPSFTAAPKCAGGACPSSVTYLWSLDKALGNLSATTGSSTTFTAGNSAGIVSLTVTATLNGKVETNKTNITIVECLGCGGGTLNVGWWVYVVSVVVIAVMAIIVILLLLHRKKTQASKAQPSPAPGAEPPKPET